MRATAVTCTTSFADGCTLCSNESPTSPRAQDRLTMRSSAFSCLFWHDLHLGLSLVDYQNHLLNMNHMRLGYMAYVGCNDRVQDYIVAQHAEAEHDTAIYLHRTIIIPLPSGGTKKVAVPGPATATLPEIIRPELIKLNPSNSKDKSAHGDKLPPKPNLHNFSNLIRFSELWNINIDLKSNSCAYLRLLREFL